MCGRAMDATPFAHRKTPWNVNVCIRCTLGVGKQKTKHFSLYIFVWIYYLYTRLSDSTCGVKLIENVSVFAYIRWWYKLCVECFGTYTLWKGLCVAVVSQTHTQTHTLDYKQFQLYLHKTKSELQTHKHRPPRTEHYSTLEMWIIIFDGNAVKHVRHGQNKTNIDDLEFCVCMMYCILYIE